MALTVDQKNFVKELAFLAYGTGGSKERTAGGKGNMGLLYGQDGVHVFKFNTHGSQADKAQRDALAGRGSADVVTASNALRSELEKLALSAGLAEDMIAGLLGENTNGKNLLTRKIVARFVTGISENCQEARDVWDGVKGVQSASDMSFEKVAHPQKDYAKFNHHLTSVNAAFVKSLKSLESGASNLHSEMDPREGALGWLGEIGKNVGFAAMSAADYRRAVAELKKLDARGFGFLAEKRPLNAVIGGVIKDLKPELTNDDIDLLVFEIMTPLQSRAYQALVHEPQTTFTDVVKEFLLPKLEDMELLKAQKERRELKAALAELKAALDASDLKDEMFIKDNFHIITTVVENYHKAMKGLGDFATKDDKNVPMYVLKNLEADLALKTLKGHMVDIHKGQGLKNILFGMNIAHNFVSICKLAKEKGRVHGLLLAMNEDGCFSARMEAIQNFVARLEGADVTDVQHKPGESIAEGLMKELAVPVQAWLKAHPSDPANPVLPKWKEIKKSFADQMRGKEFAGIVWTPHKIYENITEDVLELMTVEVDDDFRTHKADLAKVHYADL